MRILRKIRNKYTEVKRMKYIVSGCTGHLGLNLVKYLLSAGKTVKAIALPGENTEKLSEHGAEVVYGDVTDRDFVFSQVEQGCVFFHLAGVIDITSGNKDKVYLVNVKGTENVADACLAKGARLVYTSSVHVKGKGHVRARFFFSRQGRGRLRQKQDNRNEIRF